ncbi:Atu1372/SO_1960 family protein [Sphingobacterium sp. HMA12]|uniref:Atu1372/SO_1960 family protein n=1 Tax=Sphingobacterium sp. HMA12 TaxID=2050894 RepID=UPI000CEA1813|nr:Atu1372/SO_1960 family protein [Sphingobacterium sp. HMA12]
MKKIYASFMGVMLVVLTSFVMAQEHKTQVLVLIHSDHGGTYELAKEIVKGVERSGKVQAVVKLVKKSPDPKLIGLAVATVEELPNYDGIAFGSPVYFGNISTGMSEFLAKTVDLWSKHALEGIPATVFMSAGSGAGKELALQSFWNTLAVHGMILVPTGIQGNDKIDKSIPQGNTVLGTTSLASLPNTQRPSKSERYLAELQGMNFAKVASGLVGIRNGKTLNEIGKITDLDNEQSVNNRLKEKHIVLPKVPQPAGNYQPYVRAGNLVFINQVALKDGKIFKPGKLGMEVSEQEVKEATEITMLNVLSVLNDAVGGDLNRVKRCVQLTGIFNTEDRYSKHADLMNVASNLAVTIFGDNGKHARATFGASSLPINSSVEIQAIFEID